VKVKHLLIEESKSVPNDEGSGVLGKRRGREETSKWVSREENKLVVMAQFDT
jgi:ribosomal protein L7Ae-like RNA K-turn-binding protein